LNDSVQTTHLKKMFFYYITQVLFLQDSLHYFQAANNTKYIVSKFCKHVNFEKS